MKKKWIAIILGALLLLSVVAGCAASRAPSATSAPAAPAAPMPEMPAEMPAADNGTSGSAVQDAAKGGGWLNGSEAQEGETSPDYGGHKIIKTASMGFETREFDTVLAHVKQKTADMGGYVATSYVSGKKPESYNDSGRRASLSMRIPQERMEEFLSDTRAIATVIYENSGGEDITANYFDTQSRLEIYQTQRDHIKALLDNPATPLEDRILVEQELFRLTYEIESLTTQLRRWDDLVAFASVTIELNEIPPAVAVASNDDFGTRVSEGLKNTLSGMAVFFENLVVFLIVASPALLVIAVIVIVIVVIVRRRRRKKREAMASNPYAPQPSLYGQQPQPERRPDQPENK